MANDIGRDRDLVLAPGEFAFVLDTTKGLINTIVGPNKTSMSNTDQPVLWDKKLRRFVRVEVTDKAIQVDTIAPEGFYIALYNPAQSEVKDAQHPREGSSTQSVLLNVGHRVNIPGPVRFPLWPGQMADVIKGHHLHSNQYLLAQVYNDIAASENWKTAVVKPQATPPSGGEPPPPEVIVEPPQRFAPGQLIVIKGTDVAFFIPPTGIKVVPENDNVFVREAVTLERLEYCILLDEDGNKRFVQGPAVVFPEPTEQFIQKDGLRKFKAIELNETTGIYVKVIADYKEGDREYKTGEELFITGKEQAIYFQREEHSVIRYGDQTKHYAVAVPAGEGRYVLDRTNGVVELVKGPKMLLCDPRTEVIIRRVLAENTVKLWYPNNQRVIDVNKELEASMKRDDAAQYLRSASNVPSYALGDITATMAMSNVASKQIAGDTFSRGTTFTPPRTIILDTKYEGAVSISVWTGYAVLVISKTGHRHVVVGPETFLLEYDETLAPLELSTGTPKLDKNLLKTVYLRVHNNKISDSIRVETKDLVHVDMTLSYRVNFEGENTEKWFAVENYVRLLCDHMRSLIRNTAKRRTIEEFYSNAIDIVRDAVLGPAPPPATPGGIPQPRLGRLFTENQMRVYDIEVLDVKVSDPNVAALLLDAQSDALESAIKLSKQERALLVAKRVEEIKQETATAQSATMVVTHVLTQAEIKAHLDVNLDSVKALADVETSRLTRQKEEQALRNELSVADLERQKAVDDQRLDVMRSEIELTLKRMLGETEEITKRAGAVSPNLAVALTTFSDQALVEKISTALAPMAMMSGHSAADVLANLFKGTAFEGVMRELGTRSRMPVVK
jgi:major vault protein